MFYPFRKLFLKADLGIDDECRMHVIQRVKISIANKIPLPKHLFDNALVQVENFLNDTLYPAFLQSDAYISYIRSLDCGIKYVQMSYTSKIIFYNICCLLFDVCILFICV